MYPHGDTQINQHNDQYDDSQANQPPIMGETFHGHFITIHYERKKYSRENKNKIIYIQPQTNIAITLPY